MRKRSRRERWHQLGAVSVAVLAISCVDRVGPQSQCAKHHVSHRCNNYYSDAEAWNRCVASIESKCQAQDETHQKEELARQEALAQEERAAESTRQAEQARQENISSCLSRAKEENEARNTKHMEDVELWLREHPNEMAEIEGEHASASAAAKKVETTPQSGAPDSYGGRYYLDGEQRFETTGEADARRFQYVACVLSGSAGCDGPISNYQMAGRMEIMAFMQKRKRLAELGFPFKKTYVRCGLDGTFVECPFEARCRGGPWLEEK